MQSLNNKRVAITGLGVISPVGTGKELFWSNLTAGHNGVGAIESFDCEQFKIRKGCEVKDFQFHDHILCPPHDHLGRSSQFALAATKMALEDAGLDLAHTDPTRVGIAIGTAGGEIISAEHICNTFFANQQVIDRQIYRQFPADAILANLSFFFGIQGHCAMFPTACAAGNFAIGHACDLIRSGRMHTMIAGGVESFSRTAFTGFCRLKSVAPDCCRPFDKNRKGLVLGEGAGFLILENMDQAGQRGAFIYGEVLGFGLSCDAYHVSAPEPQGLGMYHAMQEGLINAGVRPEQVDYISAHGTGTIANDKIETLAIKRLFKDYADKLAISSIKSMIGHTLGAASAIEAIACTLSVHNDEIAPTINYETRDDACDLDYVPNTKREKKVNIAMNNAFAFGGSNTSLIIKKYNCL